MQENEENLKILINEVGVELQESDITLQQGENQQRIRDNYLAQANASYEKGNEAVKLGLRILEEAKATLNTLQGERLI